MKNHRPSRRSLKNILSAGLAPLLLLGLTLNGLPALAGIEGAPRDVPANLGTPIVPPVFAAPSAPASLGGISDSAPIPGFGAPAPLPAAAEPAPAAAAAVPASIRPAPAIVFGSAAASKHAFLAFLQSYASVHEPLGQAISAANIFDGAFRDAAEFFEISSGPLDVLPRSTGVSLAKRRSSAPAAPQIDRPFALDAHPGDLDSVEKALRALVDSAPKEFGAPSEQMGKVSVSMLAPKLPGQAASILAEFRQTVWGVDKDGSPYGLLVAGRKLGFHVKVFEGGKPIVMKISGELASGVSPDVMNAAYDDDELAAMAAKRAQLPPDRLPSSSARERKGKPRPRGGRTKPRGGGSSGRAGASSEEPAPAAAKFLMRELTDELDGHWRAISFYQASGPKGEPVIVIIDVKTGETLALDAGELHMRLGEDLAERVKSLISGTVTGRGTTAAADGGDHGPIGPIPLPLTYVYDESGKIVATTDERGKFSIPDNGDSAPVKLTIRLASPLVPFVKDEHAKKNGPVVVTVMATPGETMTVTLNPASDDPELSANIVAYVGYLEHHIWMKALFPAEDAARLDRPLAGGIDVNGRSEPGNAYYDPSVDGVNTMAAATIMVHDSGGRPMKVAVEGTTVWSILFHEFTHRVVQIFSQILLTAAQQASKAYRFAKWSMDAIMGADVNESIADVVSYFMRDALTVKGKASTVGEGYYDGNPPPGEPDYIRSASDRTPYDPENPDPHNGVLAQSMYELGLGFIEAHGPTVGAAYANAMIPLVVISQPLNPVDALLHLILWDMKEDGSSPFGDLIRRIAKDHHGIDLPATPTFPTA